MFALDNKSRMNKGATILIVEDERLFREMLCEVIQLIQPTWRIYEAKNGQEGLEVAQAKHPDLIILDFHMPVMNGYQLATTLQQRPETCTIPLILSTSEDSTHPLVRRLRALCQAVLFKPFSLGELERILTQVKFVQSPVEFNRCINTDLAILEAA